MIDFISFIGDNVKPNYQRTKVLTRKVDLKLLQ